MENLYYLNSDSTGYAITKKIEQYDREAEERELAEGNLTIGGSKNGSTNLRGTQNGIQRRNKMKEFNYGELLSKLNKLEIVNKALEEDVLSWRYSKDGLMQHVAEADAEVMHLGKENRELMASISLLREETKYLEGKNKEMSYEGEINHDQSVPESMLLPMVNHAEIHRECDEYRIAHGQEPISWKEEKEE